MKKQTLNPSGELNAEATATLLGTPSSKEVLTSQQGNRPILVMLDSTVSQKQGFQLTTKQEEVIEAPNDTDIKLFLASAAKLGTKVEWIRITREDESKGYALFFSDNNWQVDPQTRELKERE